MEFRARLTEWNMKRTRSITASQDLDAYSFPSQFDFSNRLLTNFMLSSRFPQGLLSALPSTYSKQVRRPESILNVTSSWLALRLSGEHREELRGSWETWVTVLSCCFSHRSLIHNRTRKWRAGRQRQFPWIFSPHRLWLQLFTEQRKWKVWILVTVRGLRVGCCWRQGHQCFDLWPLAWVTGHSSNWSSQSLEAS